MYSKILTTMRFQQFFQTNQPKTKDFKIYPYVMGCYDGSIRKLRIVCLGLNGFEVEYIE